MNYSPSSTRPARSRICSRRAGRAASADPEQESDHVVQRRKECIRMCQALGKAEEIVATV